MCITYIQTYEYIFNIKLREKPKSDTCGLWTQNDNTRNTKINKY